MERYQAMTERERLDFNMSEVRGSGVVKVEGIKTFWSSFSPSLRSPGPWALGGKNLLEVYMER